MERKKEKEGGRDARNTPERGNKSGKNESIGGVFHDAAAGGCRWVGGRIGGVRLI